MYLTLRRDHVTSEPLPQDVTSRRRAPQDTRQYNIAVSSCGGDRRPAATVLTWHDLYVKLNTSKLNLNRLVTAISWLIAAWTLVVPRISLEIVSCGGLRRPAVIGWTRYGYVIWEAVICETFCETCCDWLVEICVFLVFYDHVSVCGKSAYYSRHPKCSQNCLNISRISVVVHVSHHFCDGKLQLTE